ncbi:hypothetical protein F4803DRAFT_545993 [Xylaria telfairii]|nr:hypothetical protein F4803DRAFT_545993 [Xylaria telfairii]
MAAPTSKPAKTSRAGQPNNPIYTRTSVLCNGQIVWKVGSNQDMEYTETDPYRNELKPTTDVNDDLIALNSLQMYRSKPITPLELKQPLRHVQFCLPKDVKARIYTGDLYGSAKGVFSCPNDEFKTKTGEVFLNELRGDGELNYNEFFRRLRRAEWLLWDVEAEKGHWVAVIAHLYKGPAQNPNKSKPSSIKSSDFNRIDKWCVVTAQRSPEGDAMVDRVKERLPAVLREGRIEIDKNSEMTPAIWVPMDETNWSSGLRVYALIKTLMHRITEFHCTKRHNRPSFWHPVSGWLNVDEVRAEMQGRAAQRCMAATDYRSRIAIEGVRRWIGRKVVVRAKELRPRSGDNQAFRTGKVGADGRCMPVGPHNDGSDSSDDGPDDGPDDDDGKEPDGSSKLDINDFGGPFKTITPTNRPKPNSQVKTSHTQTEPDLDDFGGPFKTITPTTNKQKPDPQAKPSHTQTELDVALVGGPFKAITSVPKPKPKSQKQVKFGGPLPPPPKKVPGWETDTTMDSNPFEHIPKSTSGKLLDPSESASTKETKSHTQNKSNKTKFGGPLGPPPSKVYGWDDDSDDDDGRGPYQHIPLFRLDKLGSYGRELMKKVASQAQTIQDAQNPQNPQPSNTQNKSSNTNFAGPLGPPPSEVYGWDDDTIYSDYDDSPFTHNPVTKLPFFEESMDLKEPTTPGKPSSVWKGTTGKSAQGKKQQSQAKQDVKGKGKLVDKNMTTNSKRKAQEAATQEEEDDGVESKKRAKIAELKKGLNSILDMLESP